MDDHRCKGNKKRKARTNHKGHKNNHYGWVLIIVIWTFILSILISFVSSTLLGYASLGVAFVILMIIIFMGIIFDIIGIAVAAASEVPFHSMASQKVYGAKEAVKLIRNADKVSNFCNDVVGDIAGIISGATSATIVVQLTGIYGILDTVIVGLILTGFVASLTVGGKAMGKSVAISKSHDIIFKVGLTIYYINKIFGRKKVQ